MDTIRNNRLLLRVLLFSAGLLILAYFILSSGILENYKVFFSMNLPLFALAFCCTIGVLFTRIYRWKYLSAHYGTEIRWKESALVSISSLFYANITPGKIGDLYKAYFMQKGHNMPIADGVSMIFYERFFELMILFLAACAIVFIELKAVTLIILEVIAVILVLLVVFYYKVDLILKLIGRVSTHLPVFKKISFDIQVRKMPFSGIAGVLAITLVSLSFEFLQLWLVALAFGYTLNPVILTIFFSLSIIAGLVSQIPLGVGVMEGSLSYFLGLLGVAPAGAVAIVLSDRLISMYFVLVLGFIFSKFASDRLVEGTQ
jgi:uncharacterized protein (TIRG00374 family)